jgi:tetratricopeptide (TPR) repeat protein
MTFLAHLFDREADRCFAEAARLAPADPRWPYGRGVIALKRDPDNAVVFLRKAADTADSWAGARSFVHLQLAETLLERRQLDEAETLIRDELRREPGNRRATFDLGLLAVARGNDTVAEEYFRAARAGRGSGASKKATVQLAALAGARGDGTAVANYTKEAAVLPEDPPWPDPLLDQILELRVGHRRWEREVDQLEREGKYGEAAGVYLGQIKEHPTSRAYVGAGFNLARLHDYEHALPLLREGVRLDPESAQAHYSLALTQFTRAENEWQVSPGSPQAKEWLRETVQEARRAVALKPDHDQAYRFWGLSLKYLGEAKAAVEPLRKAVDCRPDSFDLQLELGETLLETNEDREAATYLENARRLDPQNPRALKALESLRAKKD